jgi:uncharacterized tellurite resistance protein B-like protein
MSFASRLVEFVTGISRSSPADDALEALETDERLAAAALLVHVARADGDLAEAERDRLLGLLQSHFGLTPEQCKRFFERADEADLATDDVASLVELMGHDVDPAERRRLLGMAYVVASADGRLHEFEDDLIWRIGRLFGFDDAEITLVRGETVPPGVVSP